MIPLHLTLSGFLSYQDRVELDFTPFELACIAGANGAGKSSLLDAITWALFGQARKRDDSLVNSRSEIAEVSLIFEYEGNIYRVQRTKPLRKTTMLEFQILQGRSGDVEIDESLPSAERYTVGTWKPLTERTLRETDARIQQTLRLDYETFVNASFFLQGKADQFTQQSPGDRKRILGSILGLEIWETYRQRAAEQRRQVESEISVLDGRLQDIAAELGEEAGRKARLKQLTQDLERVSQERTSQEQVLASVRQVIATHEEQQKMVELLARQVQGAESQQAELVTRLNSRKEEQQGFSDLLDRADQIEAEYLSWQENRAELEKRDRIAASFQESEKRRQGPLGEIQAERVRLEQERKSLLEQQEGMRALQHEIETLQPLIDTLETDLAVAEAKADRRERLRADLQEAEIYLSEKRNENKQMRQEMNELKSRIEILSKTEEAVCPTCGRMLSGAERLGLIGQLKEDGTQLGDRFRDNQELLEETDQKIASLKEQLVELGEVDAVLRSMEQKQSQLTSRLETFQGQLRAWEKNNAPRLEAVTRKLSEESFSLEARQQLAEIDAELKAIGYDAAAHDALRKVELAGRSSEADMRSLEKARAAISPLAREIDDLESQVLTLEKQIAEGKTLYNEAADAYREARKQAPDLHAAERALVDLQEQENRLRLEVGAARQKVDILATLKTRREALESEREQLAMRVAQYRQLERAFGKDGVPALLIEQALPEIEIKANQILERLSDGSMFVRFVTQAAYKDTRREDLRETLEIQISDSAGVRDYEMYSGGESFRVNFAIRLALSEVLAQRAGARLQTLVIDEGFGSQDALGRQRLIEAINLVKPDFAKILVITHIEELKDAFPTRIDVVKTDRGSRISVN